MSKQRQIESDQKVLDSLRLSKVILPVVIGLIVLVYILLRQFDLQEFNSISWNNRLWFFLGIAVFIYVLRHIFYSIRLKILSDNVFTFRHSLELVCIWEFASAISPTSIGGSAVAVFFLSQEKISGAKAVSIVMYTVIIDSIFFLVSLVLLLMMFGPRLIRPNMESLLEPYGITFMVVWLFILFYATILTWGLFRPRIIKNILFGLSKLPLIRRFKRSLVKTGQDVVTTSREIRNKPFIFHLLSSLTTIGAWMTRFLTVNFIILALVEIDTDFMSQFLLYARSQTMYVITQFSPTPGGSGVMELLFSGFFSDYVTQGIGSVGALLWRLITYYPYLLIGVIIIPNWLRRIMSLKKKQLQDLQASEKAEL